RCGSRRCPWRHVDSTRARLTRAGGGIDPSASIVRSAFGRIQHGLARYRDRIIAPDGGDAWAPAKPRPDETLIRALTRAHRWKCLLEGGRCRAAGGGKES